MLDLHDHELIFRANHPLEGTCHCKDVPHLQTLHRRLLNRATRSLPELSRPIAGAIEKPVLGTSEAHFDKKLFQLCARTVQADRQGCFRDVKGAGNIGPRLLVKVDPPEEIGRS